MIVLDGYQFTKLRGRSWLIGYHGEAVATIVLKKNGQVVADSWNSSQPKSRIEDGAKTLLAYLASGGDPKSNL